MKAIETLYNGYRFRSRVEARWAVFFDALNVPFEYEREGYDLGDGLLYLPDFWLPKMTLRDGTTGGAWIEIKGQPLSGEEVEKCSRLARVTNQPVIAFVGPPCPTSEQTDNTGYEYLPFGSEDFPMAFMQCHRCQHIRIEYAAESDYHRCPKCGNKSDDESPDLLAAYKAARAARFEFGEAP